MSKIEDPEKLFQEEKEQNIKLMGRNAKIKKLGLKFVLDTAKYKYAYNFTWLGRPIIQIPQDIIAVQELIWETKPDLIVETGIAHGGSLVLYASLLELLGRGEVVGVDIEIRPHNRKAIQEHFLAKKIKMIEGSSIDPQVVARVKKIASTHKNIMVCLDSSHTNTHVLKELEIYSPLVRKGNYIIVFDTTVEQLPKGFAKNRPWDKGNNPGTAVHAFLKQNKNFALDWRINDKLLASANLGGFLKRVK